MSGVRSTHPFGGEKPRWASEASAAFPRQTAHEFTYTALRRAILSGDLPGGARLIQSEIAEQLGVSTTPVREALRSLTSEGLVMFGPHRGGIVRGLSLADFNELFEIRSVLEPLSLRLAAARISEQTLAEMERVHDLMEEERDLATWIDLNRRFHELHREAAQSPRLHAVLTPLQDATAAYTGQAGKWHPEVFALAQRDHAAIIDGLRRGDEALLTEVILQHMQMPRRLGPPDWNTSASEP